MSIGEAMVPVNGIIVDSGNGLVSVPSLAITWTSDELFPIETSITSLIEIKSIMKWFPLIKLFEYVIKYGLICLLTPSCFKYYFSLEQNGNNNIAGNLHADL